MIHRNQKWNHVLYLYFCLRHGPSKRLSFFEKIRFWFHPARPIVRRCCFSTSFWNVFRLQGGHISVSNVTMHIMADLPCSDYLQWCGNSSLSCSWAAAGNWSQVPRQLSNPTNESPISHLSSRT